VSERAKAYPGRLRMQLCQGLPRSRLCAVTVSVFD